MNDEEMTGTGPVYGPTAREKATQDVAAARWGISYHSISRSPRVRKWYRVARLVFADGGWFELYWHPDTDLRGNNHSKLRRMASLQGITPLPGLFRSCDPAGRGGEMEREL